MWKTSGNKFTELRVTRAYLRLLFVPEDNDGNRTVSLARIGSHEVRLVEVPQNDRIDVPPFWLELYAHDQQASVDSCSCREFEHAVAAAEHLIDQAKSRDEHSQDEGDETQA